MMPNTTTYIKRIYASFSELLTFAGLMSHYNRFILSYTRASRLFAEGKTRAALNLLSQLWLDPHIIAIMVLYECFKIGKFVYPNWISFPRLIKVNKPKTDGTMRVLFVPNIHSRVAMGVINNLLQASCASWTSRTHGFRSDAFKLLKLTDAPHEARPVGTLTAINAVSLELQRKLAAKGCATLVFLDIKKAFNSVNIQHMFSTLQLAGLSKDIKYLIWQWQHAKLSDSQNFDGLAQGFAYSPTLFAWYLDTIFKNTFGAPLEPEAVHSRLSPTLFCVSDPKFVNMASLQSTDFVIYADNIVGVFYNESEVSLALKQLTTALIPTGLTINQASVSIVSVTSSTVPFTIPWLGHHLEVPTGRVTYNSAARRLTTRNRSAKLTKKQWSGIISNPNWKTSLYLVNARRLSLKRPPRHK